jgi:hypothetical protein
MALIKFDEFKNPATKCLLGSVSLMMIAQHLLNLLHQFQTGIRPGFSLWTLLRLEIIIRHISLDFPRFDAK